MSAFDHVTIRVAADAFWAAGTAAGHPDDGAPGERPQYRPGYYAAFLRDPDGNSPSRRSTTATWRSGPRTASSTISG